MPDGLSSESARWCTDGMHPDTVHCLPTSDTVEEGSLGYGW